MGKDTKGEIRRFEKGDASRKFREYIQPKPGNQALFAKMIEENLVIFGVGPAGTGKTLLAVQAAVTALRNRDIEKVIMLRPLVEVGNHKIGAVPGTVEDKIAPYMEPFNSSLELLFPEKQGKEELAKYMKSGQIAFKPLDFMRGSTFRNMFVIADEMQNSTPAEIEMLLTRFGDNSKLVITGDPLQSDLPRSIKTGLEYVSAALQEMEKLGELKGIAGVKFTEADIARHQIVRQFATGFGKIKDGADLRRDFKLPNSFTVKNKIS